MPRAWRYLHLQQTGSTNAQALKAALDGQDGDLWIVAESQSEGRGRLGRPWVSPPGNLYASLLLIDPSAPRVAPQLSFVMAVALTGALESCGVPPSQLAIKWPNDVLLYGAKLAGILIEGTSLPDGRFACVAGVGVNCAHAPELANYPAISLSQAGFDVTPQSLLDALAQSCAHWISIWNKGAGFAKIREAWLARAAGLGTMISAAQGAERISGLFTGLDADGRLLLDTDAGMQAIDAGDIFLGG